MNESHPHAHGTAPHIDNHEGDASKEACPIQHAAEHDLKMKLLAAQVAEVELRVEKLRHEVDKDKAEHELSRTYHFFGKFTAESVAHACNDLAKRSEQHPGEPLTFRITSSGGSVYYGLALYDILEDLKRKGHHLTTQIFGAGLSIALFPAMAGDDCLISKNSDILIHEVSGPNPSRKTNITTDKQSASRKQHLWEKALRILVARTKASGKQGAINTMAQVMAMVHQQGANELRLSARQAVRLGIFDGILGEKRKKPKAKKGA